MHHDLSNIEKLQIETLMEIFSYLTPEDIANQKKVSKRFFNAAAAPLLWKKKFKLHFPHRLKEIPKSGHIDWYNLFVKTYNEEYINLLDIKEKKFFSLLKEGDLESLKVMSLNAEQLFHYLSRKDTHGQYAYEWAHTAKNSQELLDFIYQTYLETNNEDFFSKRSISALHWAILCNQSEETIERLLKRGCDVNKLPTVHLDTPIVLASKFGLDKLVKLLIANGAKIQDFFTSPPLIAAIEAGQFEIVKILLEKRHIDIKKDIIEGSFLHIAAKHGNPDIVTKLLEEGAEPNKVNSDQLTPLHIAAKEGHYDVVIKLLDKGANLEAVAHLNATPLHLAAEAGHSHVVGKLLERGANVNVINNVGYTPLHEASGNGQIETVIKLLKAGANTELLTIQNHTASQLAEAKGHQNIVRAIKIHKLIQKLEAYKSLEQPQKRRKTDSHHEDMMGKLTEFLDFAEKNIAKADVQEEIIRQLKFMKDNLIQPQLFFAPKKEEEEELKHKKHDDHDINMQRNE